MSKMILTYNEFLDHFYCLSNCNDEDSRDLVKIIALCSFEESGIDSLISEKYFKENFKDNKLKYFEPKYDCPSYMQLSRYTFLDEVLDKYWKLCEIDIDAMNRGESENSYSNILYISDSKKAFQNVIDKYKIKEGKFLIQIPPLHFKQRFNKFLNRYIHLTEFTKNLSDDKLLTLVNMILSNTDLAIYNLTYMHVEDDYSIKLLFKNFIENPKVSYAKFLEYRITLKYKEESLDFNVIKHLFSNTQRDVIIDHATRILKFKNTEEL